MPNKHIGLMLALTNHKAVKTRHLMHKLLVHADVSAECFRLYTKFLKIYEAPFGKELLSLHECFCLCIYRKPVNRISCKIYRTKIRSKYIRNVQHICRKIPIYFAAVFHLVYFLFIFVYFYYSFISCFSFLKRKRGRPKKTGRNKWRRRQRRLV